ncbi:MAG: viperin family antiviral radical SAM protein [Phycisphaerales bacterium]|nr:viperin family antiviral radical SAM protein [Phycisphaerales bacterium]
MTCTNDQFPNQTRTLPDAVNFHFWKPCNNDCRFCFATFNDDARLRNARGLPLDDCRRVLDALRSAGVQKITLAGGEPTLCPHIGDVLAHAHRLGFVTSLVTNGSLLPRLLNTHADYLDWVGLSVDSADEAVQRELGRGIGDHVGRSLDLFERLHQLNISSKLNTVVTSLNHQEDMADFVLAARPRRWKIFQVLAIRGQNDGRVEPLLVSGDQFAAFVDRHQHLEAYGIQVVTENNDAMTAAYAMVDPIGRFFSDAGGVHSYSEPILEVGVERAFSQIKFDPDKFDRRGGSYDWSTSPSRRSRS